MTPKIITGKKGQEKLREGKRGRGRPAVFDRAVALQAAMKLFWERGYEGTSFDDLIAAMGISASSFYNSFGSKEALYCEATRSYLEWSGQWFFAILNDPSINTKTAFARLFEATAEEFTRGDHPLGCMISLAGTHCSPGMSNIRDMMAEHRAFSESAMAARIRKGAANGDVPEDTDCDMLAAYYSAVARGLAVQARDGATCEKLAKIGRLAMSAWPAGKSGRSKLGGKGLSHGT
jgi:AcrR family transcriptional regulator